MNETVLDWASEKFAEELKRIPSSALIGAILSILLFWSADIGCCKSALLGLMQLTPADLTDDARGISNLPFFVFLGSVLGSLFCYGLLKHSGKQYFRFVCQTKPYQAKLEAMVLDHKQLSFRNDFDLLKELRSATVQLEKKREPIRLWIQAYYWMTLLGTVLVIAAFKGNVLDFSLGIVAVMGGFWGLFRSVGVFLATVTPWHAKCAALTRLITSETSLPISPQ